MPTANTMDGTTSGEMMSARSAFLPGMASRISATDAMVPMVTASTVTSTATLRLRTVAASQAESDQYAAYQRIDTVLGGNSRKRPPLNDMPITMTLGRIMKASTTDAAAHRAGCAPGFIAIRAPAPARARSRP